jgi:hypothetical protein
MPSIKTASEVTTNAIVTRRSNPVVRRPGTALLSAQRERRQSHTKGHDTADVCIRPVLAGALGDVCMQPIDLSLGERGENDAHNIR